MRTRRGRIRPFFGVMGALATVSTAVLARRWLDVVEVRGGSMAPALLAGDWLVVERWSYRRRPPRHGEVVVAADPRDPQRELLKRIARVAGDELWIAGDNGAASTDSATFGALPLTALRWRAVARYWPPRRVGLIARTGDGAPSA
ncbi:MAG: S26 family signal peptidase [Chloroflexota bacterium]|nr:S26 family signal peptidase [Chloroflexota bacterium]